MRESTLLDSDVMFNFRLVDEEHQTEKIDVHAYLALTDEIPLILGVKDLLASFKVCFNYKENSGWLE